MGDTTKRKSGRINGSTVNYLSTKERKKLYMETGVKFDKSGKKRVIDISSKAKADRATGKRNYKVSERVEFVMRQLIGMMVVPNPPKLYDACKQLGISMKTYYLWQDHPIYLKIKEEYRTFLKKKWGADIDAKLIERCLTGSKGHMGLYYQLQGELTNKVEISNNPREIPNDPARVKEEIDKLIAETSSLLD